MKRPWLLLLWAALLPGALHAQSVTVGISRDSILVGDPVRIVLRIDGVPANTEIVLPDSLAATEDVENGGRLRMRRDTMPGGVARITAVYPVILWRPGATTLPVVPMIVKSDANERTEQVKLPTVNVLSVLPADTTAIEPKPPKDVWGANRLWWPWLLAAAVLLLVIGLLIWWYRKRRKVPVEMPQIPMVDPRERALKQLQHIAELRLAEQGQFKQHYILLSETLRNFATAMEPEWSTDLTTEELAPRVKRRADAAPLITLLRSADTVKFARRQPTEAEARNDLQAAEQWVRAFNRPAETAEAA
jgi:hypothetical protein